MTYTYTNKLGTFNCTFKVVEKLEPMTNRQKYECGLISIDELEILNRTFKQIDTMQQGA